MQNQPTADLQVAAIVTSDLRPLVKVQIGSHGALFFPPDQAEAFAVAVMKSAHQAREDAALAAYREGSLHEPRLTKWYLSQKGDAS